jgi:hypothetical protein|tara:strand:- start:836 stop:1006 length:171 start_codon:yes stop_codon:yes gene_type:complete
MKENLNIAYHKKILIKEALRRADTVKDAAILLKCSKKTLFTHIKKEKTCPHCGSTK